MDRGMLCSFYFHLGLSYSEILHFLAHIHGVCISMRTLKRILCTLCLFRRRFHSDVLEVAQFIEENVSNSGNQQGYRWMHLRCLQHGMIVSRDTVGILMQLLDLVGIQLRLRRRLRRRQYFGQGPDYIWHVDSYDKLKQYGLCINGCIDGFSRQVIWLNVYITSSNPKIIAGYYVEAVQMRHGCPALMRGDRGTENGHVAQMQDFMTGKESFIYGRSTANQRIEMFWNFLRRQCCQFWIDTLGMLKEIGQFTGDFIDISLIQFCFMGLLQNDIDSMVQVWNVHRIRPTKNQNCPNGRPVVMYKLPMIYGTRNYLQSVDEDQIELCREVCAFRDEHPCDRDVFNICTLYMEERGWTSPTNIDDALQLYCNVRNMLLVDLLR